MSFEIVHSQRRMAPVFGYWKIRGLGQSPRLLLEYTGQEYKDRVYVVKDGDMSDWLNEKENLGLDFPNLPYYIDGDLKLTQSVAILQHVGRQHNMCGTNEKERAAVDMLVHVAGDMRLQWGLLVYLNYDTPGKEEEYLKNLNTTLERLSKYLGSKKWFIGDSLTIADFLLYELLDVNTKLKTDCLDSFKNLQEYNNRFEALPAIKKYRSSSRFIAAPVNAPSAKFDIKP